VVAVVVLLLVVVVVAAVCVWVQGFLLLPELLTQ
jgi:hypothetical protein